MGFREYFFQYDSQTGGSVATSSSISSTMDQAELDLSQDPFNMGGRRNREVCQDDREISVPIEDPIFSSLWLQPSYNGPTGGRLIRRSCQLFEENGSLGIAYGQKLVACIRDCALSEAVARQGCDQNSQVTDIEKAKEMAMFMQEQ